MPKTMPVQNLLRYISFKRPYFRILKYFDTLYLQRVGCDLQGVKQMLRFPSSPSWAEAIWSLNRCCDGGATGPPPSLTAASAASAARRREPHNTFEQNSNGPALTSDCNLAWHRKRRSGKSAAHWCLLMRSRPEQKSFQRIHWELCMALEFCCNLLV